MSTMIMNSPFMCVLIVSHFLSLRAQDLEILVQPTNANVCLGSNAIFNCTISRPNEDFTTVGWQILNMAGYFVSVDNRDWHIVSETYGNESVLMESLIVTNVAMSNNGTLYRCSPVTAVVISNSASLTVAGPPGNITDLTILPVMITPSSFVAQWSEPSSDPVCGTVQFIVTVSTGGILISNDTIERTTYTATGLCSNKKYLVEVTSFNQAGVSVTASMEITTNNADPPNKPEFSYCITYSDGQPILLVSAHVIVDFPRMSLMLQFTASYQTGTPTVMDATCSDIQDNIQYNCTAEFTVDIIPAVEIIQSVNVTVSGPYGSSSSVMEVEQRVSAIMSVETDISQDSALVMCKLACPSTGLQCMLCNSTADIDGVKGSVSGCSYRTLPIRLDKLARNTIHKFCVVAMNITNMIVVGDVKCESFRVMDDNVVSGEENGSSSSVALEIFIPIILINNLAWIIIIICSWYYKKWRKSKFIPGDAGNTEAQVIGTKRSDAESTQTTLQLNESLRHHRLKVQEVDDEVKETTSANNYPCTDLKKKRPTNLLSPLNTINENQSLDTERPTGLLNPNQDTVNGTHVNGGPPKLLRMESAPVDCNQASRQIQSPLRLASFHTPTIPKNAVLSTPM